MFTEEEKAVRKKSTKEAVKMLLKSGYSGTEVVTFNQRLSDCLASNDLTDAIKILPELTDKPTEEQIDIINKKRRELLKDLMTIEAYKVLYGDDTLAEAVNALKAKADEAVEDLPADYSAPKTDIPAPKLETPIVNKEDAAYIEATKEKPVKRGIPELYKKKRGKKKKPYLLANH